MVEHDTERIRPDTILARLDTEKSVVKQKVLSPIKKDFSSDGFNVEMMERSVLVEFVFLESHSS